MWSLPKSIACQKVLDCSMKAMQFFFGGGGVVVIVVFENAPLSFNVSRFLHFNLFSFHTPFLHGQCSVRINIFLPCYTLKNADHCYFWMGILQAISMNHFIHCLSNARTYTSSSKRLKKKIASVLQLCQQPGSSQFFLLYHSYFVV